MLKFLFAGAVALAITSGARAQDYLSAGPAPSFGGAEAGGQLGAAVGGSGDVSATGAGGGVYAGYHLQNGPIVGGVEGDVLLGSINGNGRGGNQSQNFVSSLRARGGYAFGNILAYGTIGPAWGTSTFDRSGFSADKTLHGYTVGVGGEVAITRTISARAELRHYDFGSQTYYMPSGAQKLSTDNNLLTVGIGARF